MRRPLVVAVTLAVMLTVGAPVPNGPVAIGSNAALAGQLTPQSTAPYPDGLTDHTIVVGGVTRTYRVHVPSGITQPTAIVFVLHGGGGEGSGVADNPGHPLSMYRTVANAEGFIAVYPEGLPDIGAQGYPSWTDCRSDNQVASGADDVGFLATLIEEIRSAYGLGSERIFMAGSSNGAQMTQAFAFNRPDLVAAVASNAGGQPLNPRPGPCTTGPTARVPILLGHGTADPQMPYEGGCVANLGGACNRGRVISAEATRDRWLAINGLTAVTPSTTTVNTNANDAGPANRFAYAGDDPVDWWRFDGGGHMAPSKVVLVTSSPVNGVQNRDVEFAALAWDFFEQQIPVVTPPGAPTGLVATAGDAQATLTWNQPTDTGGGAILDYVVEYAPNGGTWATFADATSGATGATVTGLTNGTAYAFRVTATNSAGAGSPSTVTTAEPRAPATPPGAPTDLFATPGDTQVTLTWSEPSDTGGAPILDYVVEYAPSGGGWSTFADGISDETEVVVTSLTNGTAYAFRVAATNTAGTGSPTATTAPVTPLDPVLLPGQPGIPTVVPTPGALLVTVSPPSTGGLPTSYEVTARSTTLTPGLGVCSVTGATGSCTVADLAESGSYRVTVVASNEAGDSVASLPSPAAPRSVTPGAGSPEPAFDDVPAGKWFTRPTSLLKDRGITTGLRGTNNFNPTGPVTRAEMAAFLWRMAGSPAAPSSCGFADGATIPSFALEATCWLKIQGVTVVTTYRPLSAVSRAEMAAFLWRFVGAPTAPTSCGFADDAAIPSYARPGACWLRTENITVNDAYNPSGAVTRSQMAAFVYRTGAELGLWLRIDD